MWITPTALCRADAEVSDAAAAQTDLLADAEVLGGAATRMDLAADVLGSAATARTTSLENAVVLDLAVARTDSVADGEVFLGCGNGMVDWAHDAKFYEFWKMAAKDGKFTLTKVLPGPYTLHAWADGVLGEYARPTSS